MTDYGRETEVVETHTTNPYTPIDSRQVSQRIVEPAAPGPVTLASRIVTFALPVLWLSHQPGFQLHHVWITSMVTVALQAVLSLWLLRGQLQRRTQAMPAAAPA